MLPPLLEIKNLTRRFGGVVAVNDASFSVQQGQIFSIIGPNGAGKSTLFNCICGIYQPTAGSIEFEGKPLTGLKPHQIAALGIARTFQNIELFSHMTTLQNLMLGRHVRMQSGLVRCVAAFWRRTRTMQEEIAHRERVEQIIDLLDLQSARDLFVSALPYGRQKLVELGRALALEPKLLLIDEPAAGMTSEERHDLFFWLKDIVEELGVTILMIEHNMQMVMDISDKILAMDFGRTIIEGSAQEVASHPQVIEAYLGESAKPHAAAAEIT
jgi:branched-chain amino acid transport system ATP-binding protein